jgi:hypothetical protein
MLVEAAQPLTGARRGKNISKFHPRDIDFHPYLRVWPFSPTGWREIFIKIMQFS